MIRKANSIDVREINKLGLQLHDNFELLFHIETEIDNKDAIILINEEDEKINSYLYALDFYDNIDLLSIFVDNKYRHKNIAYNMILYLKDNYPNRTITLEVNSTNEPALNLYKKFGFKVVNVRKNYYQDKDAYIMKWGT